MNQDQPVPPNTGQYDFIVNPQKPPKQGKLLGGLGSGSLIMKIAIILGGAVVLMIVIAILVNIFFGSKTNIDDIVSLTQTQSEVVRISAQGQKANDQALKNTAESSHQIVASQQQSWLVFLKQHGRTVKEKELAAKKNTKTDQALTLAQQANTYDTTYRQSLRSELTDYASALQTASDNASDTNERTQLVSDYKDVQTLLKQLPEN